MDNCVKPLNSVFLVFHGVNPSHCLCEDAIELGATIMNDLPSPGEIKSEVILVVEPCNLQEQVYRQAVNLNVPVVSKSWLIACKMFEMRVKLEHFVIAVSQPCHLTKDPSIDEKEVLPFRRIDDTAKSSEDTKNVDNLVDSLRLQAELLQLSPVSKATKKSVSNVMSPSTVDRVYAETKEMRRVLAENSGKLNAKKT